MKSSAHEQQTCVLRNPIPACMAPIVDGCQWSRQIVGKSRAEVYLLVGSGDRRLYLKYGRGSVAQDITDEMVRLRWLAERISVPPMRYFVATRDETWLLTDALPGLTAYQVLKCGGRNRGVIVDALAGFLQRLHALPVEACPFDGDHRLRLFQAQERMAAGLVDTRDFDNERAGWSAQQVWDQMMDLMPFATDAVATHGDLALNNILMDGGQISGVIDVARAGVADRYQDLAILWHGLGEFDEALQERLLSSYGIEAVDERKLRFYLALDEFF